MCTSCKAKQLVFVSIVTILALGACNLASPGGELDSGAPVDTAEDGAEDSTDGGESDDATDPPAEDETDTHTPNPLTVTFQKDDSSRATGQLDAAGGSLTTTDAAGITYTLAVPSGALVAPESITLTPFSAIPDAPVSSSFRVGVALEPSGLSFVEPATLNIEVPAGLPANPSTRLVAFAAESTGEEFHFARIGGATGTTVTIPIRHFSAAGAVEASDSEVQEQQEDHPPTDVEDWAEQELATDPTIETEAAVLRGVHAQTLATIASAGSSPILMDQAFAQMRFWKLKYNTARGEVQARLAGLDAELIAQFVTTFELALVQAKTACRNHDLSQIGRLLRWSYLVLTYPDISAALTDSQSIREDAVNCAQFELEFQSRIEAISHEDPITTAVSGTIPIGAAVGAVTGISLEGEGALSYTQTTYFDTGDCNTTFSGQDGLLRVLRVDLGLNLSAAGTSSTGPGGLPALDLGVHLAPEGLTESVRMVCSGTVVLAQQTQHWAGGWAALHLSEGSPGGFEIRGWIPGNAGDPVVGTKQYSGGDEAFSEQSQLRLIHRPAL